jgi:hypothetical protein
MPGSGPFGVFFPVPGPVLLHELVTGRARREISRDATEFSIILLLRKRLLNEGIKNTIRFKNHN